MAKRAKDTLTSEAWEEFRLRYESSDDRTCAILCSSYIDDLLHSIVADTLLGNKKARNGLLSDMMPLSTFSARINLAYCLNIIPHTVFSDLNSIRRIRNSFAHQVSDLSFSRDPIRGQCMGLIFPGEYLAGDLSYLENDPRQYFVFTCAMFASFCERPHGHFYTKSQSIRAAIQ